MRNLLALAIIIVGVAAYIMIVSSNGAFRPGDEAAETHLSSQKNIQLEPFTGIDILGAFKVKLIQDEQQLLEASGDEGLVEAVRYEVQNGTLKIWMEKHARKAGDLQLYIHSAEFHKLNIHGTSELESQTPIRGESLELRISGTGDVNLDLYVKRLETRVSGAGDLDLKGTAEALEINLSGAGNIDAEELLAQRVEVRISGTGNADVHASESLDVSISGLGNVTYSGEPTTLNKRISGMGRLNKK